ncbi:Mechanosensitive ion channel domain-containing protein [Trichoderma sp. SZMC 28014]
MDINYGYIPRKPVQTMTSSIDFISQEGDPSASTLFGGQYDTTYTGTSDWGHQPLLPLPSAAVKSHRRRLLWWAVRYAIVFIFIFVILLIPIIVLSDQGNLDDDAPIEAIIAAQRVNLGFYIALWLEMTWVFAVFFDIIGLVLPYLFRFIARYVNSAHQRYWRVSKFMRRPICFLGTTVAAFIFFSAAIQDNPLLLVDTDPEAWSDWNNVVSDVLQQLTLWMAFYLIEKVVISYIAIHYHYRRTATTLDRTKNIQQALIVLYEASLYLHKVGDHTFSEEDTIIRNAKGGMKPSARVRLSSYFARLGLDSYKFVSLFGSFISDDSDSHWLRPGSSYATIERAWANPTAAAALARRIWLSLVPKGQYGLAESDIIEILGPKRTTEAKSLFKAIDANDGGYIPMDDFVGMVTEAGQQKHHVFKTIADMDHCINTLDWLFLLIIAAVMIFFIMLLYVPAIKEIQSVLSSLAIGLSFAIGRTINHLLTGITFIFFDHPFDSGDVVRLCTPNLKDGIVCTVKRQSLTYTVFRRFDSNSDLQISNEELVRKSIENFTRSEINKQCITMFLDFRTSFKDLNKLQAMLETFVTDNSRDYVPGSLAFNITSLHELNKMEVRIVFTHRNNWSDEKLRSMRSNKFHCNLIAACRQIPLFKPGALLPAPGENGNPLYTAQLSISDVTENIQKEAKRRQGLRWDNEVKKEDIGAQTEESNEEVAAKIEAARKQAEVANEAKKTEKEAFQKVSRSVPEPQPVASSTGVNMTGAMSGLRLAMRHTEEA